MLFLLGAPAGARRDSPGVPLLRRARRRVRGAPVALHVSGTVVRGVLPQRVSGRLLPLHPLQLYAADRQHVHRRVHVPQECRRRQDFYCAQRRPVRHDYPRKMVESLGPASPYWVLRLWNEHGVLMTRRRRRTNPRLCPGVRVGSPLLGEYTYFFSRTIRFPPRYKEMRTFASRETSASPRSGRSTDGQVVILPCTYTSVCKRKIFF